MREFTKSMMSYTWAMSLFSVQQIVNVFRPAKAAESFTCVTKATEEELGGILKATFHAGDNLQRGVVDMTFGMLTLGMLDRGGASRATSDVAQQTGEALRQGGRVVSQAADAISQTVKGATAAVAQQSGGWAATPSMARDAPPQARKNAQSGPRSGPSAGAQAGQQGWGPMPTQASGSNAPRK
jgi:hypothetical protein